MSVRAGVSVPGPFFVTFPILPIAGGLLGLILIPAYLMFYLMLGGLYMMGLLLYALVWSTIKISVLVARGIGYAVEADQDRQLTPSTRRGISTADRELLRKLGM